jgi:Ku70/Ku80-like protein
MKTMLLAGIAVLLVLSTDGHAQSWGRGGAYTGASPRSAYRPESGVHRCTWSIEREKISFNQINKKTGNRIRYRKVDAETGDEVDSSDIIKGYEVGKGQYIEIEPEELEAIAIESKRTIEIDEFVPKKEIDELYLNSPYYLVPMAKSVNRHSRSFARRSARKAWWHSAGSFSPLASTLSRSNPAAKDFSV